MGAESGVVGNLALLARARGEGCAPCAPPHSLAAARVPLPPRALYFQDVMRGSLLFAFASAFAFAYKGAPLTERRRRLLRPERSSRLASSLVDASWLRRRSSRLASSLLEAFSLRRRSRASSGVPSSSVPELRRLPTDDPEGRISKEVALVFVPASTMGKDLRKLPKVANVPKLRFEAVG